MDFLLKKIADVVSGEVVGDDSMVITGINSLDEADTGEISFFFHPRYKKSLVKTKASAVIVNEEIDLFKGPQVLVLSPELAYARVAGLFAGPMPRRSGISEKAVVHDSSRIGKGASVYPGVYIGEKAEVGDDAVIFPGVFVGDRVSIGDRSVIYPNVSILQDCIIGNDVIIHAGTVIGSDGFGFVRDGSVSVKIPQIGIVQIDDHVEIGANNCIDRAALGKTWIMRGVKTDSLVQVGHNVIIGEDTVIVAQAAIAGSVKIGREVVIGGQVGISDHMEIGDRAMIGSRAGIAKPVPSGEVVSGAPAMPHRLFLKTSSLIARLPKINDHVRDLEKRVQGLERLLDKEKVGS